MSNKFPQNYEKIVLSQVDSTNAFAARNIDTLVRPTWILGLVQTAGRGRRGRAWNDPAGNFAATLVLHPNDAPDRLALRSFLAALALYDALAVVIGNTTALSLKWPNDVLLNGSKVAGILLETIATNQRTNALAVGIGVNLAQAPEQANLEPGALQPVSVFQELGVSIQPEQFLDTLATCYADYEQTFQTFGFDPIRHAWLARAAKIGEVITARTGTAEYVGRFDTINETGQLVLETSQGRRLIAAADVYF